MLLKPEYNPRTFPCLGCWCPGSFHRWVISSQTIDNAIWQSPCLSWEKFSTTCVISVLKNDRKCKYDFMSPIIDSAPLRLSLGLREWPWGIPIAWYIDHAYGGLLTEACYSNSYKSCEALSTLRPEQHAHHLADDIFKCNFLNKTVWISTKNKLKYIPERSVDKKSALVQVMGWCRRGTRPLPEAMLIKTMMLYSVTRPQWVKHMIAWHISSLFIRISQSIYDQVD